MPRPRLVLRSFALLSLAATLAGRAMAGDTLTLATWNLEWLMTPATHAALRDSCTREGEASRAARSLPCDVARLPARSAADFARLRDHAQRLDADVIALQEVDGPAAARQVFTSHDFCFTARPAVQNNGFAIRRGRGIRFVCEPDYGALSVGHNRLRAGARLTLFPGTSQELHLLGVHLKSGCARQPLTTPEEACELLSRQILPLQQWIEAQAAAGHRFVLMGDFNRRLAQERGAPHAHGDPVRQMWPELDRARLPGADLTALTAARPYIKCHISETHGAYIDHIIAGEKALLNIKQDSFRRVGYAQSDAVRFRLSDHCPIAVEYRLR